VNTFECVELVRRTLTQVLGFEQPEYQALLLLGAALGEAPTAVLATPSRALSIDQERFVEKYLSLTPTCPVQLYLGYCEIDGVRLVVSRAALLPGTETAHLIELSVQLALARGAARAVDVGTGCGVLAITLARRVPSLRVYATDLCAEALALADANVQGHGLRNRISLHQGSWLKPLSTLDVAGTIDLVVSNPPYCVRSSISDLPLGFSRHAPTLAIDGGPDGLDGHRAVISEASRFLRPNGTLVLQTDSGQTGAVLSCVEAQARYSDIRTSAGSGGKPRFVIATKSGKAGVLENG
jgi:release factor glutamine methyltransferase